MSLGVMEKDLTIRLEDEQEGAFDPTASPDPAFDEELSKRKPGGLGLYLVRKMIHRVEYERKEARSVITLTHPLE